MPGLDPGMRKCRRSSLPKTCRRVSALRTKTSKRPSTGDASGVRGSHGAVRRHVGHDDERRVDGGEATVHDDTQPRRRRFPKMVEGGPIVGEPPLPPSPGRGATAFHGLLDLGNQAVALLAQEQLAVARTEVRRDDLAVHEEVEDLLRALRVVERSREQVPEPVRHGEEGHRATDGGGRRRALSAVSADADEGGELTVVLLRPLVQALEIGEHLEGRAIPAGGQRVPELQSGRHGLPAPRARRDDDLDRPRPGGLAERRFHATGPSQHLHLQLQLRQLLRLHGGMEGASAMPPGRRSRYREFPRFPYTGGLGPADGVSG